MMPYRTVTVAARVERLLKAPKSVVSSGKETLNNSSDFANHK